MSGPTVSILDRVRKPEYTGENRCVPCTVVNGAIAVVASVVAALVALELAAAVFAVCVLAIYLRGYLVPGTPALTKRYLPDRVLATFDERRDESAPADEFETAKRVEYEKANRVDPDEFLTNVGAITTDDAGEWELTDEFAALVEPRVSRVQSSGVDRAELARVFDVEPDAISFKDREYPAIKVVRRIRKWPADGALATDVGTDEALRELTDRWAAVPLEQRLELLESLRLFRENCPACEGEVGLTEETVESCCRLYPVVTLECVDCGLCITELDPATVETGGVDWELSGDPGVVRRV